MPASLNMLCKCLLRHLQGCPSGTTSIEHRINKASHDAPAPGRESDMILALSFAHATFRSCLEANSHKKEKKNIIIRITINIHKKPCLFRVEAPIPRDPVVVQVRKASGARSSRDA